MSLTVEENYWKEFCLETLDQPDYHTTNKIDTFLPQCTFTNVILWIESMMEEFEFVLAEDNKFEN